MRGSTCFLVSIYKLLLISIYIWENQVKANGQINTVAVTRSTTTSYTYDCRDWSNWWKKCKAYKEKTVTVYQCKPGWQFHSTGCTMAICGGKTNENKACIQSENVTTKFGWQFELSNGTCKSPDKCVGCSKYFYNDGPKCTGDVFIRCRCMF